MERITFQFDVPKELRDRFDALPPWRRRTIHAWYRVVARFADRTVSGEVCFWSPPHLREPDWGATGSDGHRAEHEHWWQAVWAATVWDGKGYPFPVARSREQLIRAGTTPADQQLLDDMDAKYRR